MSRGLSESGQASALVLVGLMVLAIPTGLALAQGLTASSTATDTATVVTPTLPPVNLTETSTTTPTPTPDGDDNNTDGNTTTGQTHFVNAGGGIADGVTAEEGCSDANHTTIQGAVDAAEPDDTVAVCPGMYSEHVEVTTANLTITVAARVTQAAGDVSIMNTNESAVWINAPGVTLQGFNISVDEGANYAIEVGGKEAVIRGNTVNSPGIGIFLSDGHKETGECQLDDDHFRVECDPKPPVDPTLGAATQGRVVNNTISADFFRIWVDADQTVVQNNYVTDRTSADDPARLAEDTQQHPFQPKRYNSSIVSSGNGTVIRGNNVQLNEGAGYLPPEAGIQVGKTPRQGHNMATNNTIVANSITNPDGGGIKTRRGTNGTIIRGNIVRETPAAGIRVSDTAIIRNNTVTAGDRKQTLGWGVKTFREEEEGNKISRFKWETLIINNTLSGHANGVALTGVAKVTVKGNIITQPRTFKYPTPSTTFRLTSV